MEAVPRLPMISFDLKTNPVRLEFQSKLRNYIKYHFNEDPDAYTNQINQLEGLRAAAAHPPRDVSGCATLKRYYSQLQFLSSRFPIEKDTEGASVNSEMAIVLHNIGALHSQLGAEDPRTSSDGMKLACTHFQCAAWAFQHVTEKFPYVNDLNSELLTCLHIISLGQAQECILEKSMLDNRKATIIAKVAAQTVEYYKQAMKMMKPGAFEESGLNSRVSKKWNKYLQFKVTYHGCISLLYQGQQAEEQQKMGERVAYCQAACEKLEEARNLIKGLNNVAAIKEALTFTQDVVEGKRKAAKNENEFIYHETVPDVANLPEIKGASLVKGIAFDIHDPEVSGPDIFAQLVPLTAHEDSSIYSEELAKLLRKTAALVEQRDTELATFLATLRTDFLNFDGSQRLPGELIDRCAALNGVEGGAVARLVSGMHGLADDYHDVQGMLNEIQELLNREREDEKEYQGVVGKRPPSIVATDLTREAVKYVEAHLKGSESNETLHKAMMMHLNNLKLLSLPLRELESHVPIVKIEPPDAMNELQMLMGKVSEMRIQRASFMVQLRDAISKDDITQRLATFTGEDKDQLFQEELKKHQPQVNLIKQNLAAQDNIVAAVKEAYSKSAPIHTSLVEQTRRRENFIASLMGSYDAYEDLVVKCTKGQEFYSKLSNNVSKLLTRVRGTCKVQEEEREQILAQNTPKESNPKLKDYLAKRDVANTVPAVRPAPLGEETESSSDLSKPDSYNYQYQTYPVYNQEFIPPNSYYPPEHYQEHVPSYSVPAAAPTTYQDQNYSAPFSSAYQDPTLGQMSTLDNNKTPSHYSMPATSTVQDPNYARMPDNNKSSSISSLPNSNNVYQDPNYLNNPVPSSLDINNSRTSLSYSVSAPINYQGANYPVSISSDGNKIPPVTSLPFLSLASNNYQDQNYSVAVSSDGNKGPTMTSYPVSNTYQDQNYSVAVSSDGNKVPAVTSHSYATPTPNIYQDPNYSVPASSDSSKSPSISSQSSLTTAYGAPYVNEIHTPDAWNYYPYQIYGNFPVASTYTATQNYEYTTTGSEGYTVPTGPIQDPSIMSAYYTSQYTQYNPYMQAGTDQPATISSTNNQTISSPVVNKTMSNVDLLAGLDFEVKDEPLIPKTAIKEENKEKVIIKSKEEIAKREEEKEKKESIKVNEANDKIKEEKGFVDALMDDEALIGFKNDISRFEKFVSGLMVKTLNGPSVLDHEWKKILDKQVEDCAQKKISVARCYPMKNRCPDILPYDENRVELPSTKDDYINASYIPNQRSGLPSIIVTQAPLPVTYADFWTMVLEQQIEVIVCLLNDTELAGHVYWPVDKTHGMNIGKLRLSLQTCNEKSHWIERVISLTHVETKISRIVVHLQLVDWPGSSFPASPGPFLSFVQECTQFFNQQRSNRHPALIHCVSGVGRTGLFTLILFALRDIHSTGTIPDITVITSTLNCYRKNALRDREHLKFAYQSILYYSQNFLLKRGILSTSSPFEEKKTHSRHPSEDYVTSGVKKMSLTDALDPHSFTLSDDTVVKQRQKFTPGNFINNTNTGISTSSKEDDPLSSLDPLWSLKK